MRNLVFLVFLAGCADGSSVLQVTVDSKSNLTGVDHLAVDVADPQGHHAELVNIQVPGNAIPPKVDFALRFPASVRGLVHVAVDAVAPGGASLAHKETDTPVAPSTVMTLALIFGDDHSTLPPAKLAFTPQPMNAAFSYKMTPVQVTLEDAMDQATTSTALVTVALASNPANAHLTGTLSTAAVNGVATFSDLRIDGPGTFTLTASSSSLPDVTSSPFDVGPPMWAQATTGVYGGAMTAVAAGAVGGARVYAGSDKSGVFTSTNGGLSWVPSSTGLPTHHINFLAVDQTNSQNAFAATDQGIFKTTNGGTSWSPSFVDTPTPLPFSSLAIDPANHLRIYAGTYTRVIVSTDGGGTWNDDSAGLTTAGKPNNDQVGEVRSILITGTTLYAATYHGELVTKTGAGAWVNVNGPTDQYENCITLDSAGTMWVGVDGGLWKKPSGGAWAKLTTAAPNYFKPGSTGCVVQIDAMNYLAASRDTVAASGGVVYSSDGGISWNVSQQPTTDVPITSVVVDPSMTSRQFITTARGVYRGSGGGGWTPAFGGLTALPITTLTVAGPGALYAGTDNGGLFSTGDSGMNWGPANGTGATTLPILGVHVTALVPGGGQTLFAGVNFSGVWKSTDGAATWTKLTNGIVSSDIDSIAIAPTDPMLLYAGYGNGLYKTINGGTMWTDGNLSSMGAINALAIDPASSTTLYAGTGTVWKTINGGGAWNMSGTGLPAATPVNALAIDASNPMVLFAATDGGLFGTTNGGGNWTPAAGATGKMLAVAVNPMQPNIVLASGAGGVFRSYDGGATFAPVNGGLADLLVNAVAFDKADAATLWAGTAGAGVYKTP